MLDQLSAVCDAGREHHLCKYPECACTCHLVMLKGTASQYTDLGRIVTDFVNDHMDVFAQGGYTTQMHDVLCAKLNAAHADTLSKAYKERDDKHTEAILVARELKLYTDVLMALKRLDREKLGYQLASPLLNWNWAREAAAITATSYTTSAYRNAFAFGFRTAVFRASQVLDEWMKQHDAAMRALREYLDGKEYSDPSPDEPSGEQGSGEEVQNKA